MPWCCKECSNEASYKDKEAPPRCERKPLASSSSYYSTKGEESKGCDCAAIQKEIGNSVPDPFSILLAERAQADQTKHIRNMQGQITYCEHRYVYNKAPYKDKEALPHCRRSPWLHLVLIIARNAGKRNTVIVLPYKKPGTQFPILCQLSPYRLTWYKPIRSRVPRLCKNESHHMITGTSHNAIQLSSL